MWKLKIIKVFSDFFTRVDASRPILSQTDMTGIDIWYSNICM